MGDSCVALRVWDDSVAQVKHQHYLLSVMVFIGRYWLCRAFGCRGSEFGANNG